MILKPWEYKEELQLALRELQAEYDAGVIDDDTYQIELDAIYKQLDGRIGACWCP